MDLRLAEKPRHRAGLSIEHGVLEKLEERLGRLHARQRLGIEGEREGRVCGQGINFFHPENWYLSASFIRTALIATALCWRARKTAEDIKIRRQDFRSRELPGSFDGFSVLHPRDWHADVHGAAMRRLI